VNESRRQRVKEVLFLALEAPPSERESVVEHECAGDSFLQSEVQDLLAHSAPEDRLNLEVGSCLVSELPEDEPPEYIGECRIIRQIASGAGGVVYEASHDELDRRVAVKVLHSAVCGAAFARRWRNEARILARLEHPGIARIYDAGLANRDGLSQPFIAMEFIAGERLDEFVRAHILTLNDTVELVARIADAVHYAHTRGVIHRDLKPDNILVRDDGQPVILDFGIARLTDTSPANIDGPESIGFAVAGTLGYMAPEQASGSDQADTRSDVYSLGAICFKLLTDRVPVGIEGKGTIEALATIRDGRTIQLRDVRPDIRGDIPAVLAMALAASPDSRYQSAAALAQDLRSSMHGLPVLPRPWSMPRDLRRWGRQYRVPVVLTVLTLSLVAALFATQAARKRALELQTMDNLVQLVLSASSSEPTPDRVPVSKQVLDLLSQQAAIAFKGNPRGEGKLRLGLATQYGALSAYAEGAREASRSLELLVASGQPDDRELYRAAYEFADLAAHAGNPREAELVIQRWLLPRLDQSSLTSLERARVLRLMGESSTSGLALRLQYLQTAQQILESDKEQPWEWDEYIRILTRQTGVLYDLDRHDQALQVGRAAIQAARDHSVRPYAWLTASLQNHGTLLMRRAEEEHRDDLLPEAQDALREALKIKLDEGMQSSIETLATMHNLARALSLRDPESDEAESLWRTAIQTAEQTGSQHDFRYGAFLAGYGRYLVDSGHQDEGIDYLTRGIAILEQFPDVNSRLLHRATEAMTRARETSAVHE
jgi:serine/threonine protein kinase